MAQCGLAGFPDEMDALLLGVLAVYALLVFFKGRFADYLPVTSRNIYDGKLRIFLKRATEVVATFLLYLTLFVLGGFELLYRFLGCIGPFRAEAVVMFILLVFGLAALASHRFPIYRRSKR